MACPYQWVPVDSSSSSLPAGAVAGGYTEKGELTYVARCVVDETFVDRACGAYIPSLKVAFVLYGIKKKFKQCDILVCHDPSCLFWVNAEDGHIPDLAVGIYDRERWEKKFVARSRPGAKLNGRKIYGKGGKVEKVSSSSSFSSPILGMLHIRHKEIYLVHNKQEYTASEYQVLCAYRVPAIKHTHSWIYHCIVDCSRLPEGIVPGGVTDDGKTTCIARSIFYGTNYAGYLVPSRGECRIPLEGKEYDPRDYCELFAPMNPNYVEWRTPVSLHATRNMVLVNDGTNYCDSGIIDHSLIVGRTLPGATLVPSSPHSQEKVHLKQAKIIGTVFSNDNHLCVSYKGQHYTTTQFEVLIAPYVPHTLLELSRYAVLRYTKAVPDRIDKLPLPERMKSFCQLRQEEKKCKFLCDYPVVPKQKSNFNFQY